MRSRWFHRPLLHSPTLGLEKRATWLELFYDLIFVAAFIQLGNGLSEHVTVGGALSFAGVFVPLWVAWTGFTFYENRYTVDDFTHRLMVFAQMFAVGGMAISAPGVLAGRLMPFSIAAGVSQLIVAVMYLRSWLQGCDGNAYSRFWGLIFAAGGALWLIAAFAPPMIALPTWAVATLVILLAPLSRPSRLLTERFPLDFEHLGERYALLTLIVLGESFVKVLATLAADDSGGNLYARGAVVLLITCSLWWIYFDDVAGSHIRKGRARWVVWLYFHLPLQIGIIAVGVAVKKAVLFGWDAPAPNAYRWLLAGALSLSFCAVAAIDSVTERKQAELSDRARINARWLSGLLLLVLAPAGSSMSGGMFLSLVTGITVAQVVFDMMMAPIEASAHAELGMRTTAEVAREKAQGGTVAPRGPRRDISQAVRKGTPSELRRDLYFYFIEGSWLRVFVAVGFLFVVTNLFFAALYQLEPDSIRSAPSGNFADAFFFSVQTLSTIGYGSMSPGTPYADGIVAVEAAVGMIGVALVTGLVFAKFSRPRASVLFSKSCLVTEFHGRRTLMFRAGNARGNEVVDASMTVSAVLEELSPEGHHFRRLVDLPLTRSRSPLFLLTWTVMHTIDDDSPLSQVDMSASSTTLVSLVTTLTGHDGTYGQTIYARHNYYPEDILLGHRFVDVLHELPDGRLMIDYTRFHDTQEDPAHAEPPAAGSSEAR